MTLSENEQIITSIYKNIEASEIAGHPDYIQRAWTKGEGIMMEVERHRAKIEENKQCTWRTCNLCRKMIHTVDTSDFYVCNNCCD